jgi:hypothetical protein
MGITRERVRQIQVKALKRLQHNKRRKKLQEFWDKRDSNSKCMKSSVKGKKIYCYPKNGKEHEDTGHPCGETSKEKGRK